MSKDKAFAGLDAIPVTNKITKKRARKRTKKKGEDYVEAEQFDLIDGENKVVGGQESAQKAIMQTRARKKRTLTMRLSLDYTEIIDELARKLKKKGLQYSDANAVRLALLCFDASEERIEEVAEQIKSEDRRKNK